MLQTAVSLALIFLSGVTSVLRATTIVGSWVPIFKGIDHSVSTNVPGGTFPNRQVVHAFRVDLTDPDIRLMTTPRFSNYVANASEVGGVTVSDFLKGNHLQAAINANFFYPNSYYLPAGTPMDVYGLQISQGVLVSPQSGSDHAAAILFDSSNQPTFVPTNWPVTSVTGVFNAVSGNYPLVIDGRNIINRATALEVDPRTVFGLSQDRRYLYLVGIDGRQPGYSDGANDYESAAWLLLLGAYDGVNVDGGGSTTLVIEDTTGIPVRLNRPSAVADSGRERTVGSHLGLFAKRLPGFINDVLAFPDETLANVTWTTIEPSTTQVQFGVATNLTNSSALQLDLVTNHVVQLTGLTPNTGYYFRVLSSTETQQFVSPLAFFVTSNYVTTSEIFGITNSWKFSTADLDGTNWTSPGYIDSGWSGPGAGLLWVDVRAGGPNPSVEPRNTQMPANPSNSGYPYVTYYFRTHFTLANILPGSSLAFSGYIDDGAVFYLNGAEIYRLRMPVQSDSQTLATSYPCGGDATCPDEFAIPVDSIPTLAVGDNVLAVEVHNYNLRSADITFGLALNRVEPIVRTAKLDIRQTGGTISLSWEASGFVLQSAATLEGPWLDVEGTTGSPLVVAPSEAGRYYRLRK